MAVQLAVSAQDDSLLRATWEHLLASVVAKPLTVKPKLCFLGRCLREKMVADNVSLLEVLSILYNGILYLQSICFRPGTRKCKKQCRNV